jgi:hypothetical protein
MRRNSLLMILPILVATLHAHGDAGLVRAHLDDGTVHMTVFTEPTPLRLGPFDLSVLLLNAAGDHLLDGDINATLTPPDGRSMRVRLSPEQATTRFMQAIKMTLDQQGTWHVDIDAVTVEGTVHVDFDMQVANALPRLIQLWPWFLPVPIALVLWWIAARDKLPDP